MTIDDNLEPEPQQEPERFDTGRLIPPKRTVFYGVGKPEQYDPKVFVEACKNAGGIRGNVVKIVRCSYKTFDRYLAKYPEIAEAFEDSKRELVTLAENAIVRGVTSVDLPLAVNTAKFVLTRRSLDWQEKQLLEVDGGLTLELSEETKTEARRLATLALSSREPLGPKGSDEGRR